VLAQMGWPDMRLPIMYTMSWPERVAASEKTWPRLDFLKMGDLTFRAPDNAKYPAMQLAYAAGRMGGTMTGVLSAANEQVRVRAGCRWLRQLLGRGCVGGRGALRAAAAGAGRRCLAHAGGWCAARGGACSGCSSAGGPCGPGLDRL
jgi:hypothetical protein